MRYAFCALAVLTSSPVLAHSGAHIHPHGSEAWLAVALAAVTVVGTMVAIRIRGRK